MLPRDFLIQLADKYDLSSEQKETFVESFATDKTGLELTELLHISPSALSSRMTGIYRKFSISGKGPVKQRKLSTWVNQQYQTYNPSTSYPATISSKNDIDILVQQVRQKRHSKIQEQCGKMRMLDIEQPIATTEIYTDINILEKISSQQRREIPELLQSFNPESDDFDRLGLSKRQEKISGLKAVERYSKLMILGKPGAGKTTFLKWLAVKCNLSHFQTHLIPIFISLKDFSKDSSTETEFNLFNYIKDEEFRCCGITNESITELLLIQGRFLIMLDGLDEVYETGNDEIVNSIRKFCRRYFQNHFIITCRIAGAKYNFYEENFTEVEVADFNSKQVEEFVKKWFTTVAENNREEGEATSHRFIEKLNLPENNRIRKLAVTPILLNLTCLVFQAKRGFPSNRASLYEQGLDILLNKWDQKRGIKRDEAYRNLSVKHKTELLSELAALTFINKQYFFEQKKAEEYIANYLSSLSKGKNQQSTLQLDGEVTLKSIEAQHGLLVERAWKIYSFSHLTFQEYLTAKYLINNSKIENFKTCAAHFIDKRWREVAFLALSMTSCPEKLLLSMKQNIDHILGEDENLQNFLKWVNSKSNSTKVPYKPSAIRAFYLTQSEDLDLASILDCNLYRDIQHIRKLTDDMADALEIAMKYDTYVQYQKLAHEFDHAVARNLALDRSLILALSLPLDRNYSPASYLDWALAQVCDKELKLKYDLQVTKNQLPNFKNKEKFEEWWFFKGQGWAEQLRTAMIKHRNIGHNWQFSQKQKKLLKEYYNANKLLVDCLNNCEVTKKFRHEIEDTLLLPIAEIEARKHRIT